MKKLLCVALVAAMLLSMTACFGPVAEPTNDVYRADVQEYITDILDDSAYITIFEKQSSRIDGNTLTVVCVAMYSGNSGENTATFTLTYVNSGSSWTLDKCRVDRNGSISETNNADDVAPTVPVATAPITGTNLTAVSDDWKDFTFSLEGVIYQLPAHYQIFVANGWKLDGTRSDFTEDYMLPGYSHCYVYLSNGNAYFPAEIINMSGNARAIKDCDVGEITIEADDNLELVLAGGINCLSTVEEVQAVYGSPSSINTYSDYTSFEYEVDTYVSMHFYIYNEQTKYNEINLCNYQATERDATTPRDERPAYLDTYVAPTQLGSDITSTRFILDGVVYQLPCPLDAFTNNGWTIKSDSIGSLGAWNDEYGLTLAKGDYRISLTMINLSDYETYTKHCAVSAVSFDGYYLKKAPADFAQLPGGVNLGSTADNVTTLYKDFEMYTGSSYTSFYYENDSYTMKVKFVYYTDGYCSFEVKNENWEY